MAVMTPAGCVAAMAALLNTISGIGRVHSYRRIIRDETQLKLHLFDQDQNRICGWMISPAGANTTVTERNPGHHGVGVKGGGNVLTTMQFQIEGYFGIDDGQASDEVWRDKAWAVADEFNSYGLLLIPPGATPPGTATHQLPADVEQIGFAYMYGMYLLHYARIGVGFRGRTRPA